MSKLTRSCHQPKFSITSPLLALIISTAFLTACTPLAPGPGSGPGPGPGGTMTTDPSHPYNGTRPADVVRNDFYNTIEDTVKHSGTTFPTWNRKDPQQIDRNGCTIGSGEGHNFSIQIDGGPVPDTTAAVEKMKTHWESIGYTIDGIVPWPGDNKTIDLTGITPTGTRIIYSPSMGKSSIDVESECTLDPSLNGVPTPTTPPTGN
ncbi:hypothetical protein FHU41_001814 [Psychromicrobium silvestre]|uniref:LppP/LprE lipoprotein n=1 Tax=Psychromicrobium silvestre TaxID=1645614 RepID=A0A7Y9LU23_9MICC|nr:hypothetical protein [Psychromicrobium silvestre]NYE95564.1 hypothetical protein [Psychromicrobium silvestre]